MKTTRTHAIILIAAIANVVVGFGFFLTFSSVRALSEEVAVKEGEEMKKSSQENDALRFSSIIEEISPAKEEIEGLFVNRDNVIDFYDLLERLAKLAEVDASIKSTTAPDSLKFNITYEGSFDDILYFVALVETLPYNIIVDTVHLEEAPSSRGFWRGGMSITLPGSGKD